MAPSAPAVAIRPPSGLNSTWRDPVMVTEQRLPQFSRGRVPDLDRTIPARGRDQFSVGMIGNTRQGPSMTLKLSYQFASSCVAQDQLARLAGCLRDGNRGAADRGKGQSIGTEGDTRDILGMAAVSTEQATARGVPAANDTPPAHVVDLFQGRIPMTRGQHASVGTVGQSVDRIGALGQSPHQRSGHGVPDQDVSFIASRGEQMAAGLKCQ